MLNTNAQVLALWGKHKSPTCQTAAEATEAEGKTGAGEPLVLETSPAASRAYTTPPSAGPSPSCNLQTEFKKGQVQSQN